jgi:threonine/homoserine/homoserine lactone efflux protein
MIPLDSLALFALACVVLALTPGPNLMYLISRTLCQGRAAGMVSLAGTTTGFLFYAVAAALGLTAVFVAIPMLYDVVRWAGAAYLLWLAWDAVRPHGAGGLFARRDLPPARSAVLFRTGMLTSILNPKVALFYLALFPQFVDPSRGSVLAQSLVLALTQLVIVVAGDSACVFAATGARRFFAGRPGWGRWSKRALAGVFAALAARLAFQSRA